MARAISDSLERITASPNPAPLRRASRPLAFRPVSPRPCGPYRAMFLSGALVGQGMAKTEAHSLWHPCRSLICQSQLCGGLPARPANQVKDLVWQVQDSNLGIRSRWFYRPRRKRSDLRECKYRTQFGCIGHALLGPDCQLGNLTDPGADRPELGSRCTASDRDAPYDTRTNGLLMARGLNVSGHRPETC
jgi:hypothetical protein